MELPWISRDGGWRISLAASILFICTGTYQYQDSLGLAECADSHPVGSHLGQQASVSGKLGSIMSSICRDNIGHWSTTMLPGCGRPGTHTLNEFHCRSQILGQ